LAVGSGLRGLVCSPLELVSLRQNLPPSIELVSPGIRGLDDAGGDQKRILSAAEAVAAGANWLVIGRPIYSATNPREAAEKIFRSVSVKAGVIA
jgi:orotidine-5'-phosphate decarboxylase